MEERQSMAEAYFEGKKIKTKCPYCSHEIGNWQVEYLFNLKQKKEDFTYAELSRTIKLAQDDILKKHWEIRGVADIQGMFGINPMRCVKSLPELLELQQELLESSALGELEEFSISYSEETRGLEIRIQEDNYRRAYTDEFVCPHCHNLLPPSIFHSKMVRIGLCGSQNSGKTVWICSLEKCIQKFIKDGYDKADIFFSFPENSSDGITGKYREYIKTLNGKRGKPGKIPEGTKLIMAPVFMDFYLKNEEYLLVLYDVSGEIQEAAQRHGIELEHFTQVDGYMVMIDPELLDSKQLLKETKEESSFELLGENYRGKGKILSLDEQIAKQNAMDFKEKSILELLRENMDIEVDKDEELFDDQLAERKSPLELLVMIARNIELSIREKQHVALVLDKADELQIPQNMDLLRKNTLEIQTIETKSMMARDLIREKEYADQSVLLHRTSHFFGSVSCHVLSALGCGVNKETNAHYGELKGEFAPFGVLEPLIKIIKSIETGKEK